MPAGDERNKVCCDPSTGTRNLLFWRAWPKLELRVIGIAGPRRRRGGRAVMRRGGRVVVRRGGRVVIRREGREVMWRGGRVNLRRGCSKLELRVLGIMGPRHA